MLMIMNNGNIMANIRESIYYNRGNMIREMAGWGTDGYVLQKY